MSLSSILTLILGFSALIEVATLALRVVYHLQSRKIQCDKLHMPRIHHSYVGLVMVGSAHYLDAYKEWLIIIGWTLILSDLIHHLVTIPLLSKFDCDIGMKHHRGMHHLMRMILGPIFIVAGVLALLTPFTPGSWLIIPGLIFVVGQKRARLMMKPYVPAKMLKKFR